MVSVVIATFDRPDALARCLSSLAQSVMTEPWDCIVVDNGSTIDYAKATYGAPVSYINEPRRGKSHALNAGVRAAKGDILAFTDDDVIVDSDWLGNLTRNLRSGEWIGAGGKILPQNGFTHPRWLATAEPYNLGPILYSQFDLGDEPKRLDGSTSETRVPYGANYAFRREMFEKHGWFRTDRGPGGSGPRNREDIEWGNRLVSAGEKIIYDPRAIVRHEIKTERLRKSYFLGQFYEYGKSDVLERREPPCYFHLLTCLFFWMPRRIAGWLLSFGPQRRFYMRCWIWRQWAQFRAIRDAIRTSSGESAA